MRVITEGHVEAGDAIVKIASDPTAVTVADVDALLYLPGHPRDQLARALQVAALSPGWKGSLNALQDQSARGATTSGNAGLTAVAGSGPPAWPGFRPLMITGVDRESAAVTSLRLAAVDGTALPAALPGQYLTVRLVVDASTTVVRNYSLSGPPGVPTYRISVKSEPHGVASNYIHDSVAIGQTLDAAAPRGISLWPLGRDRSRSVSAGVGVTPVLAMLHALVADGSSRPVWWVHGARNEAEYAFAIEARGHSWPACPVPTPRSVTARRRRTARSTSRGSPPVASPLTSSAGSASPPTRTVYLCGPPLFMAELTATFRGLGFAADHVHTESFGTLSAITPGVVGGFDGPPRLPDGAPGTGPPVTFARSGLTARWADRYGSLLEMAEACRVPVRWSCRTGVCHTCETNLVSGAVDYSPEPVDAPAPGNVLICCARPRDDLVVDL